MNNLNSVLIEGELIEDPTFREDTPAGKWCEFVLRVRRFTKTDDDKKVERAITIPIVTMGRSADACIKYLKKGRSVRIVGWIDTFGGPEKAPLISVVTEYVELKPYT